MIILHCRFFNNVRKRGFWPNLTATYSRISANCSDFLRKQKYFFTPEKLFEISLWLKSTKRDWVSIIKILWCESGISHSYKIGTVGFYTVRDCLNNLIKNSIKILEYFLPFTLYFFFPTKKRKIHLQNFSTVE